MIYKGPLVHMSNEIPQKSKINKEYKRTPGTGHNTVPQSAKQLLRICQL